MERISNNLPLNEIVAKGKAMGKAIRLINQLNATLDMERGAQIAANLRSLYVYMLARLTLANVTTDAAIVAEVIMLVRKVKSGWDRNRGEPMSRAEAESALQRALELSQQLMTVAESGDVGEVVRLDAERLRLLKSVRHVLQPLSPADRSMLRAIADLNARSLGRMEHRFRAKCRDMDMLAAGRRAVRAYAHHRLAGSRPCQSRSSAMD